MNKVLDSHELRQLGKPSLMRWLFWVSWDWVLIILAMLLINKMRNPLIWIFAIILIGSRQHALAILGHDGTHGLASRNKLLNDFLTNIFCFLPFGANLNSYRVVHLEHHTYVGTKQDPELDFKKEMYPRWNLPVNNGKLAMRFFKDLIGLGIFDGIIIMKSMPIRRKRDYAYVALFWIAAATVSFITGKLWVIAVWLIALFLSNWAIFRLRIWTEHIGTNSTHRIKALWWERWLFLPHNTWYHYEHHKWPWVPFYNLSTAREKIAEPQVISASELIQGFSMAHRGEQMKSHNEE